MGGLGDLFGPPAPTGGTTTGGSTTSGGSSSSSSTGGGGGSKPAPKTESQLLAERRANNAIAELRRSYLEVLRRWGIPPSKNLLNLIERGVRGAWSTSMFMAMVRHTTDYNDKFTGLQWRTGMSEAQYNGMYAQYKNKAQDIGIKLSRQVFGRMLKRGVEFEEFSDRVDALSAIRQSPEMFEAFGNVLAERGIPFPTGKGKKPGLVKFLMGRGSKQWEKVWQEVFFTANLESAAGIQVIGKGEVSAGEGAMEITRGQLLGIIKGVEGLSGGALELEKSGINFAELGTDLKKYDFNYLKRYGLSYADLINAKLGGPGAADIIAKADKVQAEKEAFDQPRVLPSQQRAQQKAPPEEYIQSR